MGAEFTARGGSNQSGPQNWVKKPLFCPPPLVGSMGSIGMSKQRGEGKLRQGKKGS